MAKAEEPERKGVEREFKRGAVELAVLHLLGEREAYGYEITTRLAERTGGVIEITDGTLYPVLYRLERAEYVAVRWETPERGVPKKYYRLTAAGRRERQRLAAEWTTFAKAMLHLLHTPQEDG